MRNRIGVIHNLRKALETGDTELKALGLTCVQLNCWEPDLFTDENAEILKEKFSGDVAISSLWIGWTGPRAWNFTEGPLTLGLVPAAYRFQRIQELLKGIAFAAKLGIENVATHVGFIPENPNTTEYSELRAALRTLVTACANNKIYFNFETGQETPVTLMRMISDLGSEYVGINFDPANLILYGKGNPVDAVSIFGSRIRGIHVKDGDYPTSFYSLGCERVVGEGSVNFPVFLPKLIRQGYTGDLYIEREITGEQQIIDIKRTVAYLEKVLDEVCE
ncbi:MAG: sugar phosphate isomerase/epimerase [Clostridia bacterium]|nr:sugar phosphate isomerase/epimerase [Clostridia bacterium]